MSNNTDKYIIIKNSAKCLKCGDVIESKHRHDYVSCKCGNLSVDGGKDYCKRGLVGDQNSYVEMNEVEFIQDKTLYDLSQLSNWDHKNKEEDYCSDCDPTDNPKCDKCLGS